MGFFFFALAILLIFVFWNPIMRWLKRQAANKAEDYLRQATGMPPRPGSRRERKMRREEEKQRRNNNGNNAYGGQYSSSSREYGRSHRNYGYDDEPIIPKEYAEDVEFVETKDYSNEEKTDSSANSTTQYNESQISDVEWTEIKTTENGKNAFRK